METNCWVFLFTLESGILIMHSWKTEMVTNKWKNLLAENSLICCFAEAISTSTPLYSLDYWPLQIWFAIRVFNCYPFSCNLNRSVYPKSCLQGNELRSWHIYQFWVHCKNPSATSKSRSSKRSYRSVINKKNHMQSILYLDFTQIKSFALQYKLLLGHST